MRKKIKPSKTVLCLIFSVLIFCIAVLSLYIKAPEKQQILPPEYTPVNSTSSKNETYENEIQSITVYITATGEKYHADGCRYLSLTKIPVLLDELNTNKYSPCLICNPMQRDEKQKKLNILP